MNRRPLGCLVVLFFLAPSLRAAEDIPPDPAPHPLGLADLEALALRSNPTLAQAAAQIEASRGKAVQAGLFLNPTVGYNGDLMGVQGTAGEMQGGFVQQTIVTAGKLRLSRAKYSQEAVEAEIRATGQQLRVLNGVRTRFYEVLAARRMVELHQKLLANAEESLRTHKEMLNTGQATRAEVLLSEVEVNRARIGLRKHENQAVAAWEGLIAVVGCSDLPCGPLAGSLVPDGPALDFKTSLERLLQDSPELQAAQAHVVHDQIMVQREKVQPIPDICLQASTGYDFENNNTVAGAQVGIQLPVFDRNQGTIQQARADLAISQAEVRRVEQWLRLRLADAFSQYGTACETAVIYHTDIVPRAAEALDVMREMYKVRRAAWPEVVRLEQNLYNMQSDYTQALLDLRRAEVMICGLLLVDGLATPPAPPPAGHINATPKPR